MPGFDILVWVDGESTNERIRSLTSIFDRAGLQTVVWKKLPAGKSLALSIGSLLPEKSGETIPVYNFTFGGDCGGLDSEVLQNLPSGGSGGDGHTDTPSRQFQLSENSSLSCTLTVTHSPEWSPHADIFHIPSPPPRKPGMPAAAAPPPGSITLNVDRTAADDLGKFDVMLWTEWNKGYFSNDWVKTVDTSANQQTLVWEPDKRSPLLSFSIARMSTVDPKSTEDISGYSFAFGKCGDIDPEVLNSADQTDVSSVLRPGTAKTGTAIKGIVGKTLECNLTVRKDDALR